MKPKQKFHKINGIYRAEVTCPDCGKSRLISRSTYYSRKSFRCMRCISKRRGKLRRKRNPNSRHISNGYITLYRPENPMATKQGEVDEHRLVMAEIIGRPLKSHEHCHHINGDKANNDSANLKLMSNAEHVRLHRLPKIKHG